MEYGINLTDDSNITVRNNNFLRNVGYAEDSQTKKLFEPKNIEIISKKITELLMGVDPDNRPIIVPNNRILNVIDSVNANYVPQVGGDIYSRYNILSDDNCPSYIQQIIDHSIEIIVSDVRNNLGMEEYNKKLSVWTTVLGDFNEKQLRGHDVIKVRERRPNPMQFFENY